MTAIEVGTMWAGRPPYPLRRVEVVEADEHFVWTVTHQGDQGQAITRRSRSRSRRAGFLARYKPVGS